MLLDSREPLSFLSLSVYEMGNKTKTMYYPGGHTELPKLPVTSRCHGIMLPWYHV